jgi:capsular exopolysaccharide synthesis family protein
MNMIEKHQSQQLLQDITPFEVSDEPGADSPPSLIKPILKRWYIVLITFLVICAIGIPAVWLLIKPMQAATAAIRVAPIIQSILFRDKYSEGVIPMYTNFVNTQADLIKSDQVLQRVADDLMDKKLVFFKDATNPVIKLREALISEDITVAPDRNSELIKITMKSLDSKEAAQIVNAFVQAYMAIEVSKEAEGGDQQLAILENEHRILTNKLERLRRTIYQMAEEYGSTVTLGAKQQSGQQGISSDKLFKMRYELINTDPSLQALASNIIQLDQGLIVAKLTLAPTNPELKRKAELLEALKARLEEKREEIGKTFDKTISRELAIQEQEEQLEVTKEMYDTVRRRIQELEMERKRPGRISVAYQANIVPVPNKRLKYTIALIFASLATGCFLAFLRDKADYNLYTPDDVTKHIGIQIIGTTTSADYVDMPKLHQQIVNDYQTIRANIGLLNGGNIPNKMVITSSGPSEGKTTFAINLATSLATAGKKVLLVDGDLRKPDIRRLLNIPKDSRGLWDVLLGESFENVVYSIPSGGFDVLTANSRNTSSGFELLSLPDVSKYLNLISAKYDHVIIDTSPVLAFPDVLLWAKMTDGVILTSFAGCTEEQDLKETLGRLAQIKVRVLGTILSNVRRGHSYYRYGYNSYTNKAVAKNSRGKNSKTMLLLPAKEDDKTTDGSES